MINLTKHETDHAHKYPNINNYWHYYTYFHDGAQRQKHHILKHYSYNEQWHKDEHGAQVRSEVYFIFSRQHIKCDMILRSWARDSG